MFKQYKYFTTNLPGCLYNITVLKYLSKLEKKIVIYGI